MDDLAQRGLSLVILILAGIYFVVLGIACIFAPSTARRFFLGFAGSALKHYLEMGLRMIVGASLLIQAPHLQYPVPFAVFGWMLVGTTAVLLLTPWTWHRRFAENVLPTFIKFLPLIGIVSLALGVVLITMIGSTLRQT